MQENLFERIKKIFLGEADPQQLAHSASVLVFETPNEIP